MAAHPDFKFLNVYVSIDVATGKKVAICSNAIPTSAREHLNMLNKSCEPDDAEKKFRIYLNENLQNETFVWDKNSQSFRINWNRKKGDYDWVSKPSFIMKTPKIVCHTGLQ